MKKLRHRKGYYNGCYNDIDAKDWTLGEELTLKELLDEWWNSVRIKNATVGVGGHKKMLCCYKTAYTCDPAYVDFDGNELTETMLNRKVKVDDYWEEDADGYPIVFCKFIEEIKEEN